MRPRSSLLTRRLSAGFRQDSPRSPLMSLGGGPCGTLSTGRVCTSPLEPFAFAIGAPFL